MRFLSGILPATPSFSVWPTPNPSTRCNLRHIYEEAALHLSFPLLWGKSSRPGCGDKQNGPQSSLSPSSRVTRTISLSFVNRDNTGTFLRGRSEGVMRDYRKRYLPGYRGTRSGPEVHVQQTAVIRECQRGHSSGSRAISWSRTDTCSI